MGFGPMTSRLRIGGSTTELRRLDRLKHSGQNAPRNGRCNEIDPKRMERETGFEPATLGLGSRCSTAELLPLETSYVAPVTPNTEVHYSRPSCPRQDGDGLGRTARDRYSLPGSAPSGRQGSASPSRARISLATSKPEAEAWTRPRVTPAPSPTAKKLPIFVSRTGLSSGRLE